MNVSVKKRTFVAVAAGLLMVLTGYGEGFKKEIEASFAKEPVSPEVHVYKSTPQGDLRIYHFPAGSLQGKPAVLMIHGGSWQGGSPSIYCRWWCYAFNDSVNRWPRSSD